MRVLVGCEFTGIVRDAFIRAGHEAMSCDLLETEAPGPHYRGDLRDVLDDGWDLGIFHPPCTRLAVSGNAHAKLPENVLDREAALAFVRLLFSCRIPRIAVENPRSVISSQILPSHQTIQPWMFGHGECKSICLWLKNLQPLVPTNIVEGREQRVARMGESKNRAKERSRFYPGIADAMASQWSRDVQLFLAA